MAAIDLTNLTINDVIWRLQILHFGDMISLLGWVWDLLTFMFKPCSIQTENKDNVMEGFHRFFPLAELLLEYTVGASRKQMTEGS